MDNLNCAHALPTNAHSLRRPHRRIARAATIAAALLLISCFLAGVHAAENRAGRAVVVERGPHAQRWESITNGRDADGGESFRTNSFVELGTGLNRWDSARREWVRASG